MLAGQIRTNLRKFALVLVGIALDQVGCPLVQAQGHPSQAPPRFEVASIKRNTSGDRGEHISVKPGGLFGVDNMSVRSLIQNGFGVQDSQISGGPGWINSERYDISAKSGGETQPQALLLMLRTLLEDRFQLKTHRAEQDKTAYMLTVADGGLKMQHAEGSCVVRDPANPPREGDNTNFCGNMRRGLNSLDGMGVKISANDGITLGNIAGQLTAILGRPVVDRTGLTGLYTFHLQWLPTEAASAPNNLSGAMPEDLSDSSLFTAVREKLGLKLSSVKVPVEVLVIDQIERPSEN